MVRQDPAVGRAPSASDYQNRRCGERQRSSSLSVTRSTTVDGDIPHLSIQLATLE
jgi:hypothetical protein